MMDVSCDMLPSK